MRFEAYFGEGGDKQIVKSFVIVSNLGCIFYGRGGMSVFLRDVFWACSCLFSTGLLMASKTVRFDYGYIGKVLFFCWGGGFLPDTDVWGGGSSE